jgi:hypothetical protein
MRRKILVPEGMLKAAMNASEWRSPNTRFGMECRLEVALRWLSENPIVPTLADVDEFHSPDMFQLSYREQLRVACIRWQQLMFLAPESTPREAVNDLLVSVRGLNITQLDERIIEAYRRGKESK